MVRPAATTRDPGRLRISLLGGFRIARGDEPIADTAWRRRSARQLVKLLATHPAHHLHREEVEEWLWPDQPPGAADGRFRKALHYARHALEPELAPRQHSAYLHLDNELVALDPDRCAVDADAFETAAAAALTTGELGALADAHSRYPGELLPEDRYEDWSAARREALAALHHALLLAMAAIHERRGERGPAAELLRRLLHEDPASEEAHRRLMTLAAASGNRHGALRQYQACRAALRDELGVDPGPETERLYQEILAGRGAASSPAAPTLPAVVRRQAERPLIGRDEALGALRAALDRAAAGDGRAVLVRGEMGVGKSRLLAELAQAAHGRGAAVLWGAAWEQEGRLPYGPIAEALDGALSALPATERERIAATHPALAALIPVLGPADDAPAAGDQRGRLFASVARVLADLARHQPLLLVLDDLHAADTATLQLLHHLARAAPGHRWLIVAAMRDDLPAGSAAQRLAAGSGHGDPFRRMALHRLARDDADALLAALAPDAPGVAPALAEAIHNRALGNPFVAIEIMRTLLERGALVRGDGGWTLRDRRIDVVPGQVRELVAARVDRLGEATRRVLALIATAGPGCSFPVLRDASGLDESALLDALDAALAARMLEERGEGYTFALPIFRPVLYERLTRPRRASMHAALARTLEARAGNGWSPGMAEALAHHWAEAGEPARAVPWLIAAADHAARVYANADAIHRLQRALTLLEAPAFPAAAAREHRLAIQRRLGDLYALTGNSLLAHEGYLAVLATDDLSPLDAAGAHRLAATQSLAMNDLPDAETHVARATALLDALPVTPDRERERLRLQITTAQVHFLALRFEEALATAEAGVRAATRLSLDPELAQAMEMAAMACLPLGRWERGARYERRHAALVDVNRFVRDIADVHFCFAEYHVYNPQPATGALTFERAIDEATRVGAPRSLALCNYYLGVMAYFHGRFGTSLAREDAAIAHFRRVNSAFGEAIARQLRGVSLTALGRLDDGRAELERGLALTQAGALRAHAQIRLYAGLCRNRIDANDARGARRYADAGLALAEEPSTCICYASFLPGATVAYALSGDLKQAAVLGARAVASARGFESPAFTCMALQATGIVHALTGAWDAALADLDEARALARTHGFPYELARVLLARAFVHLQRRERGDLRAAARLMSEASARLMRLGVRASAAQMKASMGFLRAHAGATPRRA